MTNEQPCAESFRDLGLSDAVLKALDDVGYESPSTIQAQTIPHVAARRDVVGQAQTGTGKTAAFALPLLSRIDLTKADPQVLVLTPTRELAIQVSEAFQRYAAHLRGFHVMPIYGGAGYGGQLRQLSRGVHVVVGTPGRLSDHLRRGTLKLDGLDCIVIDEADEMLRMGFIDEVEWILQQTPPTRQITLFSATMPPAIRRIAKGYLNDPVEVTIREKTATASTINQRYWMVSGLHKLDALTRILEGEPFDAMIVFVRTKTATVELAEKLEARGFGCAPLNGDIPQNMREQTVDKLRNGDLDILVATDVAARGLDVPRISHVVNYDIPNDTESYVHRIGRTGRAGRTGEAILFVAPRERRLLQSIERATKQSITLMMLPSTEEINDIRVSKFKQRITDTLAVEELGFYYQLIEQYRQEHNVPAIEIASALARMVQGETPLLIPERRIPEPEFSAPPRKDTGSEKRRKPRENRDEGMVKYRIEVGRAHGVKPGQIMGAIANEAGLDGENIGRIKIEDDHSFVDLPDGMPAAIERKLSTAWVCGQQLRISKVGQERKPARTTGKYKGPKSGDGFKFAKPGFKKKEKPNKKKGTEKTVSVPKVKKIKK